MIKKAEELFEKYNMILLLGLICIYGYSRVRYLGETSYYMHIDELRSAYDSVSLANGTGTPFSGMSLYVMLGAVLVKLKSGVFSLKLFRLIAVAAGLFGTVFSYLTVLEITKNRRYAFLEATVVTTLPVFFIPERTGIPSHMFAYIIPFVFWLIVKGLGETDKKRIRYIAAAFAVLAMIILFAGHRAFDAGISNLSSNIMNFTRIFWDDLHPYDISSSFGTVYVFSIPLLIVGVVISFKKLIVSVKSRKIDPTVILWVYTLIALVIILLQKDADIRTSSGIFFAVSLFITEGLICICENIRGADLAEVAIYLICFVVFVGYYYENFNSEVNNSVDHQNGIVVDKSVGEAVKSVRSELPDKNIFILTENFEGRNLLIALFAGASPSVVTDIAEKDDFSFDGITVSNSMEEELMPDRAYIISQSEHQDVIDALTGMGWATIYLKEHTVCYKP